VEGLRPMSLKLLVLVVLILLLPRLFKWHLERLR
jgi:hypothetical protein